MAACDHVTANDGGNVHTATDMTLPPLPVSHVTAGLRRPSKGATAGVSPQQLDAITDSQVCFMLKMMASFG